MNLNINNNIKYFKFIKNKNCTTIMEEKKVMDFTNKSGGKPQAPD